MKIYKKQKSPKKDVSMSFNGRNLRETAHPEPQFHTPVIRDVADEVKTISVDKFSKKNFIIAGNSFMWPQKFCKKRLLPFHCKHDHLALFCPDLASAHYTNATLEC